MMEPMPAYDGNVWTVRGSSPHDRSNPRRIPELRHDDHARGRPAARGGRARRGGLSAGLPLRLLGGLGVRVLCPGFPPRLRPGQDMDLACAGKGRREVAAYLEKSGCAADRMFNSLNGDRQMYFIAPSGRPVDVMVDRLVMCHTLDFRPSLRQLLAHPRPGRLAAVQAADRRAERQGRARHHAPAGRGADRPAVGPTPLIDTGRFGEVLGADWGWWRTCTGSLEKLPALLAENPGLVPDDAPFDPRRRRRCCWSSPRRCPRR